MEINQHNLSLLVAFVDAFFQYRLIFFTNASLGFCRILNIVKISPRLPFSAIFSLIFDGMRSHCRSGTKRRVVTLGRVMLNHCVTQIHEKISHYGWEICDKSDKGDGWVNWVK